LPATLIFGNSFASIYYSAQKTMNVMVYKTSGSGWSGNFNIFVREMMVNRKTRIGILSILNESLISDLVEVQAHIFDSVHLIAPGYKPKNHQNVIYRPIKYRVGENIISQISNQITSQIMMSIDLVQLNKQVDFWVFHGGDTLLLPMLTAKLLRSKVMLLMAGNLRNEVKYKKNILNRVQLSIRKINCALTDKIFLYSDLLIKQWEMSNYRNKIRIADHHFIDLCVFKLVKPLSDRAKLVGYIGRLSSEKGILDFVKAVPVVLQKEPSIKFIIIGDGPLKQEIIEYLASLNLGSQVTMTGRVKRQDIPGYLNEIGLCVLPSYTEGMPNVILEAMACGTPVLATPVGAVLDIITDKQTGFIIKQNSPEEIASGILRAFGSSDIQKIADSARNKVEREFSFEAVKEKLRLSMYKILDECTQNNKRVPRKGY
jgi:glycosyltransferase involved in cell wall biosynthesis